MEYEFLEPWNSCENSISIINELKHEISSQHILYNIEVELIARRFDCDDYLFKILGDNPKYAVVHLTWSRTKETNSIFPTTDMYDNWDDFLENRMKLDNLESML